MIRVKLLLLALVLLAVSTIVVPQPVQAQISAQLKSTYDPRKSSCPDVDKIEWLEQATGIKDGLIIPCECLSTEKQKTDGVNACGLNQVFQTVVNISQIILFLTGSAALLMFIYGGVLFIIAAGNQEQIQKGKAALQAAAIGLVVIMLAWLIVNFTIAAVSKGEVAGPATLFGQQWFAPPGTREETQISDDLKQQIEALPNF